MKREVKKKRSKKGLNVFFEKLKRKITKKPSASGFDNLNSVIAIG